MRDRDRRLVEEDQELLSDMLRDCARMLGILCKYTGNAPCGHLARFTAAKGLSMEHCLACECDRLEKKLAQLEAETAEAMLVLDPSMPESGLVDACRQVKQAAVSHAENCETLERKILEMGERTHVEQEE